MGLFGYWLLYLLSLLLRVHGSSHNAEETASERRAWMAGATWTTKAAQACLSNYLVMSPSSSVYEVIIFVYGFVSPHWNQASTQTGTPSRPALWTAHHVRWGFAKHSQPGHLFPRLPGKVCPFRPSCVSQAARTRLLSGDPGKVPSQRSCSSDAAADGCDFHILPGRR